MNAQVLQLQAETRRNEAATNRAVQALAARAAALRELMETDPAAAERLAFPASVLESLVNSFPGARAHIERRGRWAGELEYLIEDGADLHTHRSIFRLHRGSEILDVKFAGAEPPGLRSGVKLDIRGVRSGKTLVASEVELTDAALDGSGSSTTGTAPYPATCTATGPQPVLSVLVNLPNYTLPSAVTPDFARGALLGNAYAGAATSTPDWSISDFWEESSDGKTYIDATNTTVVGPVQLNSNFNAGGACDYYGLRDAAFQAIDGQVDFRRYSRIQILLPPNGACSWAGVANVGCRSMSTAGDGTFTASVAWQRADTMQTRAKALQLGTHELGHTLGMSHATSRDFGAEALGALNVTGTVTEYGDVHSTMGSWNYGFYASSHAANTLGWLADNTTFQTVESSGTYTIANYEARGGAMRALKVRRGTGNNMWLWIESRQNTGDYSSRLNSAVFGGALIHYQDSGTGNKSNLLDFTTDTAGFADAPLMAGQTWIDPYSNVSVTTNSVTPGALTVTVNYGAMPCTPADPTVVASPTAVATEYGSSTVFNVSVTNNNSTGCGGETFNLGASAPAGWSTGFASNAITLNPGQTAQTTLTIGVPAPYALGTYPVTTTAQNGAKSASTNENVTVTEPVNRLSLTVSNGGSVALSSPVKTCSSSCVTDYPASSNPTTVTLTAKPASRYSFTGWSGACTGTALTCTLTMNADMAATANFKRTRR